MPDAKYINIRGRENKMAFLWGVDYFRHDFPFFVLAPSENYQSWSKFFHNFKLINNHPQLMVCDDNTALKMAIHAKLPKTKIQTCFNHLKENIRRRLKVRTEDTYKEFFKVLESALDSKNNLPIGLMKKRFRYAYRKWEYDDLALEIMIELVKKEKELYAHKWIKKAPKTTNLIEAFNSHLESRLKSIRSFNSYEHAKLWLNGYVIKRRYTKFTDCTKKFKHLNGHCPIEMTMFEEKRPPILFPI